MIGWAREAVVGVAPIDGKRRHSRSFDLVQSIQRRHILTTDSTRPNPSGSTRSRRRVGHGVQAGAGWGSMCFRHRGTRSSSVVVRRRIANPLRASAAPRCSNSHTRLGASTLNPDDPESIHPQQAGHARADSDGRQGGPTIVVQQPWPRQLPQHGAAQQQRRRRRLLVGRSGRGGSGAGAAAGDPDAHADGDADLFQRCVECWVFEAS